jgi:hypothetical protein
MRAGYQRVNHAAAASALSVSPVPTLSGVVGRSTIKRSTAFIAARAGAQAPEMSWLARRKAGLAAICADTCRHAQGSVNGRPRDGRRLAERGHLSAKVDEALAIQAGLLLRALGR